MKESADIQVLEEMRRLIAEFRDGNITIGQFADDMAVLRGILTIRDREWSHAVTQHIVTLDSASTFIPANDEQARQARAAIAAAINGIIELLGAKEAEVARRVALSAGPGRPEKCDEGEGMA